jgi:hypothetical protein
MTDTSESGLAFRECLIETVTRMVASSMSHDDRVAIVDCMPIGKEVPGDELEEWAKDIETPPPDYYARWIGRFADECLEKLDEAALEALCKDDPMATARLYIAYQEFCREFSAEMQADLKQLMGKQE